MFFSIINRATGNMTDYTVAQLRKLAAAHAKGKGTLTSYWISFDEKPGRASLVVQYRMPDGWSMSDNIAI